MLLWSKVVACLTAVGLVLVSMPGSPRADNEARRKFAITDATVDDGRLIVRGVTKKPHQRVRLEHRFKETSDEEGNFTFSVLHHPPDCMVKARSRSAVRRAVVSNCGEQGVRGQRGREGVAGVGAGQWWYQTLSANAANPVELKDENGNPIVGRFYALLFCALRDDEAESGTDLRAAQFIVQRSGELLPTWHVSRLTPDSASDLLPLVYEEEGILKLANAATTGPWTYVCRFERLAS
jgi:hypothetical protein